MNFVDSVEIGGTRIRADGYLVAESLVARTGIQLYAGFEVGKPLMDTVRVYRPGSEVFSDDTLKSFAHIPVTNDHPDEAVTADNWRDYAVGNTGDEITGVGISIRVPLMVSDGVAIKDIQNGKRELSAGYSSELVWGDGMTPDGEQYDATQTKIRANHIAIVDRGRAGKEYRIGDNGTVKWGPSPCNVTNNGDQRMSDNLKIVIVDGLSVQTTDAGAQAIAKLQSDLKTAETVATDITSANAATIAAKDVELAKRDAEIESLKSKVLSDDDLDKRVADRAGIVAVANAIVADFDAAGLSDADIRRKVVVDKLGVDVIADKADAYVEARFDMLAEDAKVDPVRDAFKLGKPTVVVDNGQDAYRKRISDAWKGSAA